MFQHWFVINPAHFFLFQNTIFLQRSGVLCECLNIKDLQKRRKSCFSHINPPPFLYLRQSNRLAFLFLRPEIKRKISSKSSTIVKLGTSQGVSIKTTQIFRQKSCVASEIRHKAFLRVKITIRHKLQVLTWIKTLRKTNEKNLCVGRQDYFLE